ncbi:nuclear transport factor 2 family protein [Hyphobacterium sp. HN65]|uniref:Nuclear transport factor 2 family protein n=1 Tax=Hyphobacterium lacteum TaxID=3116575 RepID=A0ABU7LSZ6_9PROT|nr:nuclear transport factor 2 family protein [Hyphobacterium sp. HN65]MEE2526704.1 nuclear transport factor 2 family protein [Hyphobacterium sp. HN65]
MTRPAAKIQRSRIFVIFPRLKRVVSFKKTKGFWKIMRTVGIFILFAIISGNSFAQESETEALRVARAYVDAYNRLDVDTMDLLAADDITFIDRTAPAGQPQRVGRAEVIEGFRQLAGRGAFDLGFVPAVSFESNNVAVFSGAMDARFRLQDGRVYHWRSPVVITVTVADGHIIDHTDFADYRGAEEFIEPAGDTASEQEN